MKKVNILEKQLRYALLNKDAKRISEIEQMVLNDGDNSTVIESAKQWASSAEQLLEKAKPLQQKGVTTDSLEFDQIEKQAVEIGSPLPSFLRSLFQENASSDKSTSDIVSEENDSAPTVPSNQKIPKAIKDTLYLLRKNASCEGKKYKKIVSDLFDELVAKHPEYESEAKRQIEFGRDILPFMKEAYSLGTHCKSEDNLKSLIADAVKAIDFDETAIASKLTNQYNTGKSAAQRGRDAAKIKKKMKKNNPATSNQSFAQSFKSTPDYISVKELDLYDIHPNFISQLEPSEKWTIVIDETGKRFSEDVFSHNLKETEKGKLVAVLVPSYTKLPDLPKGYHSTENPSLEAIGTAAMTIRSKRCGVLGISAESMHKFDGEYWYVTLESLINLILRLLPLPENGQKTQLDIFVENRPDFGPQNSSVLQRLCDVSLHRLFRTNPSRAEQISVNAKVVFKTGHPWIGYADAVAFCWGGSSAKPILDSTMWKGTCLLGMNPEQLRYSIDSLQRSEPLTEQDWNELINSPDAKTSNSLVSFLLDTQGREASKDEALWNRYLEHVQKHLYSKAIKLDVLGKQIAWLKKWIPAESNFSPRMRLLWLTTQLAQANHLGKTDMFTKYQKEFTDLCDLIYPEDAPLTCLTCLHVAVAYMNDFNFKTAYDAVDYWIDKDEAIPGRQYYGQVLSTIGQLEAFDGNQKDAIECFNQAIDKFEKLTNADEMAGDINQTSSYKVITMMDSNPVPENMTTEMETYLGRTLEETADQFAISNDANGKYMHHVFLRYLVHVNTPDLKSIIDKYLSHKTEWKTDFGHPWELITFYRALLQNDTAARKAYLDQAYKQVAQVNDGTLQVIACVILGGLYYYDSSRKEELAELTQKVIDTMPYLGEARVKALKNQLESPVEPLALAKAVLPFNFR